MILNHAFGWKCFLWAVAFCTLIPPQLLSQEKPRTPKPQLAFYPEHLDLGKVPQNSKKSFDLFLLNKGNADLVITNATGACGCTAALMSDKVIKPGSRGKLRVTYDSETASGSIQEAVVVDSNDPEAPVKQYIFSAYVVPTKGSLKSK
jgi:uncharacterized protein DUF1573